ncbi:mRNA decay activator protein ZFP36 [Erythrolamprus reginae]|uniref:mRNA decay activator protein ZFP36 n=1 Tax=Erythrolamprus reginae TaxID=121349 RepID=UPI00396C53C9
MSSMLDVRNLYQNLLNLSLSEELDAPTFSCNRSASSSEAALTGSGDSALWPLRSPWSPKGDPPRRPDRSVSLIEGKAPALPPPPPPGFPPLKQSAPPTPSSRYKTELCRTFSESGRCKYGAKCQFAHGSSELRSVSRHPKYKTELCHKFYLHGECPYGSRCHFIHFPEEAQAFGSHGGGPSPHLLRQSFSFSGMPTARRTSPLPGLPDPAFFARAPSTSPPPASTDLLSPGPFKHLSLDPLSLVFGDSTVVTPTGGCCSCRCGKGASSLQSPQDYFSAAPGTPPSALPRTPSANSLSDPDCYSSSSSLSGSDSPVFDQHLVGGPAGASHRLPIFNRLSVSE